MENIGILCEHSKSESPDRVGVHEFGSPMTAQQIREADPMLNKTT